MTDVLAWVDSQEVKRPVAALRKASAAPAVRQLSGIMELDPRNRGTIYMSAGSLIAPCRYPEVAASAAGGFTVPEFLDGSANTLYIVASSRQQRALAPLVVGLISSIIHEVAERSNASGPLDPTLRVLLDEVANIAPLRDLPALLSQAAGHGIRMATMWQSLGQLQHRYGSAADEILANSTAKLFMGPISDDRTRHHVQEALGEELGHDPLSDGRSGAPRARPKATAAALQQLAQDRALLIEGRTPPAIVRLRPWWRAGELARRGTTR
jgi:type IV secretory pathway TraG/TraD family ATPase VirD4